MVISETVMKVIPEVHQIANRYLRVALLFTVLLAIPSLCHAWLGEVVHVADGDTITVLREGNKVKVRLYGIDTPETKQWYGQNAKAFTSSQVMGKTVDVQQIAVDRYKRIVGLVSVGNLALNLHLVQYGYAWVYHACCKKPFCVEWAKAEAVARKAKRGLWKNPEAIPPWEYRRSKRGKSSSASAKQPVGSGSGCDCSGNRYNCSDFKTQGQAQGCYAHCRKVKGRDVHKLDRDGDGRVCESLP
jgi:endonuclease YncB( thermonuclease family)